MKKMGLAIVVVLFVLASCSKAKAEMIWSDGFESGDFSAWTSSGGNWTTSGGNTYSGSKRAQVVGPYALDGDVLLLSLSLARHQDVVINCEYRIYAGLENNDYVFVEWPNGTDWLELTTYNNVVTSVDWQEASFLLPSGANDNPLFQLRIRSLLNNTTDCIYFDDFAISGDPIPEPATLVFLSCLIPLVVRRKH